MTLLAFFPRAPRAGVVEVDELALAVELLRALAGVVVPDALIAFASCSASSSEFMACWFGVPAVSSSPSSESEMAMILALPLARPFLGAALAVPFTFD
jgi:hypothetical protein